MVQFRSARDVPIPFIYLDHFAGPAMRDDAAVREEIRRVGKDGVEPAVGIFGRDGVEQFEGITVVQADERSVGGEDEARQGAAMRLAGRSD